MNMAKYPERERFLCGEIMLFVGVLYQSDAMSNQINIIHITTF